MQIIRIMIIGFLGKGGSGKSTLATQFSLFLHTRGKTVLAVDADHNMDLTFNLTSNERPRTAFGNSMPALRDYCQLKADEHISQIFKRDSLPTFDLTPMDSYTKSHSTTVLNGLHLMTAGPQTDAVLYGQSCSHSLTTPLKVYLPLLNLEENEFVVVDEKAGADGVSTGIVTGIDIGVIVFEPTLHSIKTAKQIAELMNFYQTPYLLVANKFTEADSAYIKENMSGRDFLTIPTQTCLKHEPGTLSSVLYPNLQELFTKILSTTPSNTRAKRTQDKFNRNETYSAATP